MKISSIRKIIGTTVIGMTAMGFVTVTSFALAASTDSAVSQGETVAKGSDCFSCHATDHKVVGPAFTAIAGKFAGEPDAETTLANAIKQGHVGTWGNIPMPAHPQLSDPQIKQIVTWILSLKMGQTSAATTAKQYTYTDNGKTVTTSFPIFQSGTKKVTKGVFRGYELFNSYCFRCHGSDALGGSYAPDLRASLSNGMKESGFLSVAMEGRKAQGMPSWAGFFSPQEIDDIYQYVKARSINVVGVGTPPQ